MSELVVLAAKPNRLEEYQNPGEAVVVACERAKEWLDEALDRGDIDGIVETQTSAEVILVYTRQKQLGEEAELAAAKVVRRADRGIGLCIRRGQDEGTIALSPHLPRRLAETSSPARGDAVSPVTYAGVGQRKNDIYAVTDGITDDDFESVLAESEAEGNLSRRNVAHKARELKGESVKKDGKPRLAAEDRNQRIAALAGQGWLSAQIATELNMSEGYVRKCAKAAGIDVGGKLKADAAKDDGRPRLTAEDRNQRIAALAGQGWLSAQIARELGNSEDFIRRCARAAGIDIPGDRMMSGSHRALDHTRNLDQTVNALEGMVSGLQLLDIHEVDPTKAGRWATSLTESIRVLSRINQQIKEIAQ